MPQRAFLYAGGGLRKEARSILEIHRKFIKLPVNVNSHIQDVLIYADLPDWNGFDVCTVAQGSTQRSFHCQNRHPLLVSPGYRQPAVVCHITLRDSQKTFVWTFSNRFSLTVIATILTAVFTEKIGSALTWTTAIAISTVICVTCANLNAIHERSSATRSH